MLRPRFSSFLLSIRIGFGLICVALIVVLGIVSSAIAAPSLNRSLNYQARLLSTSGQNVSDGTYAIKFSLYSDSSGGTPIWTASGTNSVPVAINVTVTNGLFSVLLGDTSFQGQNPFNFDWYNDSLYLGVTVDADSEMSPRKRLSSVPYAFVAETLQGQYASSSVTSTGGSLFSLNQTTNDAASATRTALSITTQGTSNNNDYLLTASNSSGNVFTISRQGNVTTTGNIAIHGNSTFGDTSSDILTVNSRIASDLVPSSDLLRSLGSSSLRWNAELGRVSSTNVYVSSTLSIGTSTQSNALTVVGDVSNVLANTNDFELVGTGALPPGSSEYIGDVQNGFYYYPDIGNERLVVVDVRSKTNPAVVGQVDISNSGTSEPILVVAHGSYVFMTRRSPNAILTIDVSNPVSPRVVATTTLSDSADPFGMVVVGTHLYTVSDSGGFYAFNIANPAAPIEVARIDAGNGLMVHRDGFMFITDTLNGQLDVVDIRRPNAPVAIASLQVDTGVESAIAQYGRYVYLIGASSGLSLAVIDIADPFNPVRVATTTEYDYAFSTIHGSEGRYLYAQDGGGGIGFFDAGASSTNPTYLGSVSTTDVGYPLVEGSYLYSFPYLPGIFGILRIPGLETASIVAASAELGGLNVLTNASIANQLSVGSLSIGPGGFISNGAFAITSTNTTSTILFAVSTTRMEVSNRLTVGGVSVCLSSGTNCPASSGDTSWTFSATNGGFIYPSTSTNDVVLGATASATAPFYFDAQTTTSSLQIGRVGNANLLVGTSTYGGGLNSAFTINGNDLFTQGMIGSIEGIYSATGVQVGTGTTVYGDGNLYKTNAGDFRFALNNINSSFRFFTSSTERLTIASNGNIGVGTSTPNEALTVVGNISNLIENGQSFETIGSVSFGSGQANYVQVQGNYAYTSAPFRITDISDPTQPQLISSMTGLSGEVAVNGRYAYTFRDGVLASIDISNPTLPFQIATTTFSFAGAFITANRSYVYVGSSLSGALYTVDVSNPTSPVVTASTTLSNGASASAEPRIQGRYLFVAGSGNDRLHVFDLINPAIPVEISSVAMGLGGYTQAVAVQGSYVYVSASDDRFAVVDISNPSSPSVVAYSAVIPNTFGIQTMEIEGRYLYFGDAGVGFTVFDVSSSTSPTFVTQISSSGAYIPQLQVVGRYAFAAEANSNALEIFKIPGLETSSLLSASAELGSLSVQTNASIANQLSVGGSLSIGSGGFMSNGAFAISSTNTTSTILFSVSTTNAEVSNRLTVGGVSVCLANGINCQGGSVSNWTFSATNGGFIYPATSTNDVILGATASATAPFYFDAQTTTSSLQIGRNGNANLLVGTSTYGGGLNSAFTLNGNDLFTQGMIGSIEGIYSATGVQVGTGTTVYGDGNLYKTNNGDFRMALNVASSSWRFYTAGTERLTVASSGNIGIGVSNPSEALDVVGSIENIIAPGSPLTQVATTTFASGAGPVAIYVVDRYAYIANFTNDTFAVVDVSNPLSPVQIATTTFSAGADPTAVYVIGRYAYVTLYGLEAMATIDVSNPAVPIQVATSTFYGGIPPAPRGVFASGNYVYATNYNGGNMATFDVSNPLVPVQVATTTFNPASGPISVYASGRYVYVANRDTGNMATIDVSNPIIPVQVATTTFNSGSLPTAISVSGRYAYVLNRGSNTVATVDISNATAPIQVATTTLHSGSASPIDFFVSGRYAYLANIGDDTLSVVDVTHPAASMQVATTTFSAGADTRAVYVLGRYAYVLNFGDSTLAVIKIPGLETSSLLAHSAELGSLSVQSNASIANQLTVGGSLNIGAGGFYSAGAFAISSTNTTSTILYAVSTTQMEVSRRLTVGGVSVCLANGTNCQGGSVSSWTFSAANGGFIYPATSTNDIILGATASATAPFYFDAQTVTSSLQIGRNGNANLLVGTSTYGGGLNSAFTVNGNDLFTQGMIGSIEGIYSATGVQVGTGTTVYGDGNLYKTNNGDFRMALNVASSSWRFYTAGNERLTVASSGNIGIGVSNPSEALDVVGSIENIIAPGSSPTQVATTTFAGGAGPTSVFVAGKYAYVANRANDTLSTVDVSNPLSPVLISTFTFTSGASPWMPFVRGSYAYVAAGVNPGSAMMAILDVSNPAAPVQIATTTLTANSDPASIAVVGEYAYLTLATGNAIATIDVSNPVAPIQVATTTFNSGAAPTAISIAGRYAYVANFDNHTMNVLDLGNPSSPIVVATTTFNTGANPRGVFVAGRYVYVSNYSGNVLATVDVSNPLAPLQVATTTFVSGANPASVVVSGRYAYVTNRTNGTLATVDVSNPLAPLQVATTTISSNAGPFSVVVSGQYAYTANRDNSTLAIIRIPGTETSSLLAHSAEIGSLSVMTNGSIANQLTVGGSLNIGMGGFYSAGAFAISSTNTTSTILFAASTTNMEVSNRLTVGGSRVCLANGANCPSSSSSELNWTYDNTSGFIRPATSTNDVVLGATASATAPFYFDAQTVTSSLQIGRNGNANLLVGSSTYGGGLNAAFTLNGNDLFAQGMIGSIEGIFSATGVQVGTGTTVYGDGNIYKTNVGDFRMALNVASSSWRFLTGGTERFTVASSGNVGIGTANPSANLDVVGDIKNTLVSGQVLSMISTTTIAAGAHPYAVELVGKYLYVANGGAESFQTYDVTSPSQPQLISSLTMDLNEDSNNFVVRGGYAYVMGGNEILSIVDVGNPATPFIVSTTTAAGRKIDVQGGFAYLTDADDGLVILNVSNPMAPVRVTSTVMIAGSTPQGLTVQGRFVYVADPGLDRMIIVDVSNPQRPITSGSIQLNSGSNPRAVDVQGRYAYVVGETGNMMTVDVATSSAPTVIATTTFGTAALGIKVSGRYAYLPDAGTNGNLVIVDISNATSSVVVSTSPAGNQPYAVAVGGRYIYVVNRLSDSINIYDQGGLETTALTAATAEFGTLNVLGNASVGGSLDIRNSLFVGAGGIFSSGALSVASTNTTSTFAFAVSTTNLEVQTRLTVGGQAVCLANGTGCPLNMAIWTESTTNNTVFLVTSTRDVLIGGNTTATAGFIFDKETTTSTIIIGSTGNANLFVGTSTYGGALLGSGFTMNGDDLFVQGQIGSIDGLFSATGVTVGAGATVYGDGNLYKTNSGDFTFALGNATNSFRFQTAGTERLTVASSGNIGIGISTPLSALDVSGTIQAILRPGSSFPRAVRLGTENGGLSTMVANANTLFTVIDAINGMTTLELFDIQFPSAATSIATSTVQGELAEIDVSGIYLYGASGTVLNVYNISDPVNPDLVGSTDLGPAIGTVTDITVVGSRVYVASTGASKNFTVIDVSVATNPYEAGFTDLGADLRRMAIQGRYAYVAGNTNILRVVDITTPSAPTQVGTLTVGTQLEDVAVQGRFAYVTDLGGDALRVIDVASSSAPIAVGSLTVGDAPNSVLISGRYAYVTNGGADSFSVADITSSTAPTLMGTASTENGPDEIALIGRIVYIANVDGGSITGYDVRGAEFNGLYASNAEFGSLVVQTHATIYGHLNIGSSLTVGMGGLLSQGGIFAAATSVFANILPATSSNFDLGSSAISWRNIYASGTIYGQSLEVTSSVRALHSAYENHPVIGNSTPIDTPVDVAVQGRFAFVISNGTSDFLTTVDISDPRSPSSVGSVALPSNPARVELRGKYAYVAHLTSALVSIVDISTPALPVVVTSTQIPTVDGSVLPRDVYSLGRYLYVLDSGGTFPKLRVLDVTDPVRPMHIRSMSFTSSTANPVALAGQGRYLYVANAGFAGMSVVDIQNPENPVEATTTNNGANMTTGALDVVVQGRFAYVNRSPFLDVYDIASATGTFLATTTNQFAIEDGRMVVNGRYLYIGSEATNLNVLDITSSTNITLATRIQRNTADNGMFISGRYLYTTDESNGRLAVISLPGAEVAGLLSASAELGSLSVLTNASVQGQFTVSGDLSVGSGGILSQGLLGVFTSSTFATTTVISNSASNTNAVLEVLGGCDNGNVTGTSRLVSVGNMTDTRKFMVTCGGNVYADGTFSSPATDFAEYFSSDGSLTVGDVLVLDPNGTPSNPSVLKSSSSASSRARTLGVFSTKPSFVGGYTEGIESGASSTHIPVALLGRVPTKASAINGAILPGDQLMVSSNGTAVKAKGPGMILGIAIEALPSGTDTIEVFVDPTYWGGDLLNNDIIITSSTEASASLFTVNSPSLSLQGSAWNGSSANTISFSLTTQVLSTTSSNFVLSNTSGTSLLTISNLGNTNISGDLTVGRKLYLGSKTNQAGSASTYIFVDDTLSPTSTYIATNADGWSTSSTFDYAERFPSQENLIPGELVMADQNNTENVIKTNNQNNIVLGIVSTKPGFVTGAPNPGTYPIALAGRVPTKIIGQINIGDEVRASNIPGIAEKAEGPGPIIGIALQAHTSPEQGTIIVFVKPGWSLGSVSNLNGNSTTNNSYATTNVTSNGSTKRGLAKIYAGATEVKVEFASIGAFPVVQATPYGQVTGEYWFTNLSDTGFTIVVSEAPMFDLVFAWSVDPSAEDSTMSFSDNTAVPYDPLSGAVYGPTLPPPEVPTSTTSSTEPEPSPDPEPESTTSTTSTTP
jgi:hypothetical protein